MRALQAGSDPQGGYLVAPQQFVVELIKAVDDQVSIRQFARKFQVPQTASLGAPSLESDPADADWTTELATGSEDNSMSFGKRQLFPNPLAKRIKVSQLLLRQALIGPEGPRAFHGPFHRLLEGCRIKKAPIGTVGAFHDCA
jgi:HK97 family phage major capsid protein